MSRAGLVALGIVALAARAHADDAPDTSQAQPLFDEGRALLDAGKTDGLAGVNLPMLMRAISYRDKDMETLLMRATGGGRDGVLNMLKH